MAELLADETDRATIRVQAGPGTAAAQAVAPVVRKLQHVAMDRYLQAVADHVTATSTAEEPPGATS